MQRRGVENGMKETSELDSSEIHCSRPDAATYMNPEYENTDLR
jgi:hypothetical protein